MRRVVALCLLAAFVSAEDPYERHIRRAPEFQQVAAMDSEWATWTYMPWYYKWRIGFKEEGAAFCRRYGINGGFTDYGRGQLRFLERNDLWFYNDHTAGKGLLYLKGANKKKNYRSFQRDPVAVRTVPIDSETFDKCVGLIEKHLRRIRGNPLCLAYSLDDEPSTGVFVMPLPWRLNDADGAYKRWLEQYYGHAVEPKYVTPDPMLEQLGKPLEELDFSPLLDRMTYNDSVWANFLGGLVEETNRVDATTPCGIVGAQNPSLWGGYDYAKLMRKLQFIEAYEMGSAPEIIRSLDRRGAVHVVSTHFHQEGRDAEDSWKAWQRFAHGQRGMIGWVDGWFDGKKPKPWLDKFAPTMRELGRIQGPKTGGAKWRHDGIAIYYSHPSIQVSWLLDSESHGKTWVNRGRDQVLGTSHNVRRAWEYVLTDSFLQYDFLAYDELIRNGVPKEYKVLILPACFALSDVEARRIREFAAKGGRVVADFMCGLFDQHGKGRSRGVLDDLFGVTHDGTETKADFFSGTLWVETNQDQAYREERWEKLLTTAPAPMRDGFHVAERKLKGPYVKDNAAYLNLSPLRYLQLREENKATPSHRNVFTRHLGVKPWVDVKSDTYVEVTYWTNRGRTWLFVVQNPILHADDTRTVKDGKTEIEIVLGKWARNVIDERTGRELGKGSRFKVEFVRNEAVFLSFQE